MMVQGISPFLIWAINVAYLSLPSIDPQRKRRLKYPVRPVYLKRLCFTSLDGLTIALFSHGCKEKPKFLQNFYISFQRIGSISIPFSGLQVQAADMNGMQHARDRTGHIRLRPVIPESQFFLHPPGFFIAVKPAAPDPGQRKILPAMSNQGLSRFRNQPLAPVRAADPIAKGKKELKQHPGPSTRGRS